MRRRKQRNEAPSFVATHWGRKPERVTVVRVQEPRDNQKLIALGTLHSVVYVTRKGADMNDVEYEHAFDERSPPALAYGDVDGKLYIVGGTYKVKPHGIVG